MVDPPLLMVANPLDELVVMAIFKITLPFTILGKNVAVNPTVIDPGVIVVVAPAPVVCVVDEDAR